MYVDVVSLLLFFVGDRVEVTGVLKAIPRRLNPKQRVYHTYILTYIHTHTHINTHGQVVLINLNYTHSQVVRSVFKTYIDAIHFRRADLGEDRMFTGHTHIHNEKRTDNNLSNTHHQIVYIHFVLYYIHLYVAMNK